MSETKIETIKCLLLGDSQVGKSSLLQTLATGKCPLDFVPNYQDKCSFFVDLEDIKENLNSNSNGLVIELSDYESEEGLNLNDFNVVLLCFSFDNKKSYESLKSKWLAIVEKFNKNLAKNSDKCLSYVLVGLKSDCIDEETGTFERQWSIRRSKRGKIHPNVDLESVRKCTSESYEKYAKNIGASDFIEMSAKEIGEIANNEEFQEKLNTFLEKIYKAHYFSTINNDKKIKNLFNKFNNSEYSRLQSPVIVSSSQSKQVESVKFKFMNLLRRCKKYVFSCTSSRYADCDERYVNLDRPNNKLRNSKIKFPQRNGKNTKLVNAESSVALDVEENDDVFY